jgi:hypothetical protein
MELSVQVVFYYKGHTIKIGKRDYAVFDSIADVTSGETIVEHIISLVGDHREKFYGQ